MAALTLRVLTRSGDTTKNAPLTNSEVDQNFINLDSDLDLKANLASPALTGTPTAPTAIAGTNTTQIATTAFVKSTVDSAVSTATTAIESGIGDGILTVSTTGQGITIVDTSTFSANQAGNATITVNSNATAGNSPSSIVFRDASGNFSAGTITAALTGNASTATTWQTARTITIGDTSKSVNGGANVSWTLSEIGARDFNLDTTTVISTNTTSVSGTTYIVTAALTLTLPASPTTGNWVRISRRTTDTVTVARNAQNIMGLAENLTLDLDNVGLTLLFADATRGWVIV